MTMHKLVNGVEVECSPEEEAQILAERAAATPTLASRISAALVKVDTDVDAIYAAVIGNRGEEYRLAESDAQAFHAAAHVGTVPASVASWATAKGWTAAQACDDILATAAAWRTAQAGIRAQRLQAKESMRAAASAGELTATLASWTTFVAAARAQLGI